MTEGPSEDKTRRRVLVIGSIIFAGIIVVSLGLAFATNISLPPVTSQSMSTPCFLQPYVVVEVVSGANTVYTTTYTTYPNLSVFVAIHPEVIIAVNGTQTTTITTTLTETSTTCS